MTGNLQPLIDSTAYWVQTDATLKLFWSVVGGSLLVATFVVVATIAVIVTRFLMRPEKGKNQ